jgi:hypothetical protein
MTIERPTKLFDFGKVQVAPAHEIDRQFDQHRRSIEGLIKQVSKVVRADGKINNDILTRESFPREILTEIQSAALSDALRAQEATAQMLEEIKLRQAGILASQREVRALVERTLADARAVRALGGEVQASQAKLQTELTDAVEEIKRYPVQRGTPFPNPPLLGPNTGGFYAGDEEGATATAADYAQVAIDWAEYMPGTIPPNILAINAITGDHWSSRWWANRAAMYYASLVGGTNAALIAEQVTVTGPNALAALTYAPLDSLSTMEVLVNGRAFAGCASPPAFTVTDAQITWISTLFGIVPGDEVIARYRCAPGVPGSDEPPPGLTLYYIATQGQTVFNFDVPDNFNNVNSVAGASTVRVTRNGLRLMPDNGSGSGAYVANLGGSGSLTLLWPAGAGEVISIDLFSNQASAEKRPDDFADLRAFNPNHPALPENQGPSR